MTCVTVRPQRFHLNGKTMIWSTDGKFSVVSEKLRGEDFKVQTFQEVPSTMGDPILKTFDVFVIVTAGESCSRRSRIGLRWSNRLLVIS